MFVHKHQLEHLLKPHQYFSPTWYQTEVDKIFRPAWHFVGSRADLPKPGDFVSFELFGEPVLLRNIDGTIHAFRNVCPHRHCLLTGEAKGHRDEFRCQYHGWEFKADGSTGRIPDAGCFRPWDRENARLHKFPLETVGELLFLRLVPDGPPLRDHLGHQYDLMAESFAAPFRLAWKWQVDFPSNWKIPIENTLEMYHLPFVHSKTFGTYPTEETCTHILNEKYSTLHTFEYKPFITFWQNLMVRRLGVTPTNKYMHHLIHPNTVFVTMDIFRMCEAFVPTSPTTTSQRVWFYTRHGPKRGPLARWVAWNLQWLVVWIVSTILKEDVPIFSQAQRGLQASQHRGVIGTLEERIYVFQKWVLETTGEKVRVSLEMAPDR